MEFRPLGLHSTLHPSIAKEGFASHMLNTSVTRGVIEARGGMAQLWKRTSHNTADKLYGVGFGRYNGNEEYFCLIKKSGDAFATGYSVGGTGSLLQTNSTVPWQRTASDWFFKQNGEYIYGANVTDGLWRKKIGDTSESAWRQVQIYVVNSTETNSAASFERPAPKYAQSSSFGVGAWAGTPHFVTGNTFTAGNSIAAANGVITYDNPAGAGSPEDFDLWVVWEFTTAVDWSTTRTMSFPIGLAGEYNYPTEPRIREMPYFNSGALFDCKVSEDATAPYATVADFSDAKWLDVRQYTTTLADFPYPEITDPIKVALAVDWDHAHGGGGPVTNKINAVKFVAFKIPISAGNFFSCSVGIPSVGGTMMSKRYYYQYQDGNENHFASNPIEYYGATNFKDLEYAIVAIDGGGVESTATFETVSGVNAVGVGQYGGALPMGSAVEITHDAVTAGSKTRIYRRRHAATASYVSPAYANTVPATSAGAWWLIYESPSNAAGLYIDHQVDADGDLLEWGLGYGAAIPDPYPADHEFGTTTSLLNISAIESWRGHMVLGVGTEVYLSYQGQPHRYVAPVRNMKPGAIVTDDPTIGRTLYMSYTLGDSVLALHAPDELYAIGTEGVYAMVGDEAVTASPFRKLPKTYGSLGARASASFESGVLVASLKGLYYYQISRFGIDIVQTRVQSIEMTEEVRDSYQLLLNRGASNDVVVQVIGDEIYIIRGRFFLKRNREQRWEFGAWSSTACSSGGTTGTGDYGTITALPTAAERKTVVTRFSAKNSYSGFDFSTGTVATTESPGVLVAMFDTELGKTLFTRSGVMMRFDEDANGAAYTSDAGYAIPWVYSYVEVTSSPARTVVNTSVLVESSSTDSSVGQVRTIIEELDGVSGSRVYINDRAANATAFGLAALSTNGGFGHIVTLASQSAAHKAIRTEVDMSNVSGRLGN